MANKENTFKLSDDMSKFRTETVDNGRPLLDKRDTEIGPSPCGESTCEIVWDMCFGCSIIALKAKL